MRNVYVAVKAQILLEPRIHALNLGLPDSFGKSPRIKKTVRVRKCLFTIEIFMNLVTRSYNQLFQLF